MVDITVGFAGCIYFFPMGLILGWVLVLCGRICDFACGGGFWSRCGRCLAQWQWVGLCLDWWWWQWVMWVNCWFDLGDFGIDL